MAIITRKVYMSLLSGIVLGQIVLLKSEFFSSMPTVNLLLAQFGEAWKLKTIFFVIMVGSIIRLITASGGIEAFISYVSKKQINSKRSTLFMGYALGVIIFLESSITALVVGALTKPLAAKYKISKAKLAYLCDCTSSPICSLFPFNGWGALLLGLIAVQIDYGVIEGDALSLLVYAIPLNFYAIVTMIVLFLVILLNRDFGPMKDAEKAVLHVESSECVLELNSKASIKTMFYPIFVMLFSVPLFLYLSGDGNILKGSGSSSIFYSVVVTLVFIAVYYIFTKTMDFQKYLKELKTGAGEMLGIGIILLLAFSLGDVTVSLKTGPYLASLVDGNISASYIAAIIFLVASVMAFSTGTSWGTFSIMMPIAIPMAAVIDANIPLVIAAVISGGVFGDHCSPISDTTIISAMAADCETIEHVRTQLPYALFSGFISLLLFLLFGFVL